MKHYTITFNPAIDLVLQLDNLQLGGLNRVEQEEYVVGGKGINMATLLNRFDYDVIATGFLGGFTGQFIKDSLERDNIQTAFIDVDGITRINTKINAGSETEINAAGPTASSSDLDELLAYLKENVQSSDVVYLAGNTIPGLGTESYCAIAELVQQQKARFVLDTNTDYLTACLPYEPFLIKPNEHELGEVFDVTISTVDDIVKYAKKLQQKGAKNVLVSRGGNGALLLTETGEIYQANTPTGQVVNSVGAGDSMVAGFMAAFSETEDYQQALLQGAASGSATAFSIGIAELELIERLKQDIQITKGA